MQNRIIFGWLAAMSALVVALSARADVGALERAALILEESARAYHDQAAALASGMARRELMALWQMDQLADAAADFRADAAFMSEDYSILKDEFAQARKANRRLSAADAAASEWARVEQAMAAVEGAYAAR